MSAIRRAHSVCVCNELGWSSELLRRRANPLFFSRIAMVIAFLIKVATMMLSKESRQVFNAIQDGRWPTKHDLRTESAPCAPTAVLHPADECSDGELSAEGHAGIAERAICQLLEQPEYDGRFWGLAAEVLDAPPVVPLLNPR